jgi:hypothetical protein
LRLLARLRREAEAEVERLLTFLDQTEADPDLEPSFGNELPAGSPDECEPEADMEPSLGAPERNGFVPADGWGWPRSLHYGQEKNWTDPGMTDDREQEHDGREDGHDAEEDPAEMGIGDADGLHFDDEPSLGWPNGRASEGIGSLGGTNDPELDPCDEGERQEYWL